MNDPIPLGVAESSPASESSSQSPRRRLLWMLLWLAAVPLVMLIDRPLYEFYEAHVGDIVPLEWLGQFLTEAVAVKWIGLGAVVLVLAVRRLRWWFMADVGLVMISQALVASGLKQVFGRVRPEAALHLTTFHGPGWGEPGYSFPSGHAAAGFALAALLSSWYPRWRWAFIIMAVAICLARLQLQRHFPSDLVFGGFVGWYLGVALTTWRRSRTQTPQQTAEPEQVEAAAG